MIRYRLQCTNGHAFEAWFQNSAAYDQQAKRRQLACPDCGTAKVDKAPMAPGLALGAKERKAVRSGEAGEIALATPEATAPAEAHRELRAVLRRLRTEVEKRAEYVGPRFAEEARRMHYEEIERRGIYGEATLAEARELREEGIEFHPLPMLPEDQN